MSPLLDDNSCLITRILCRLKASFVGKTILASKIIAHCKKSRKDFKTSYFYCRDNDPSQDNCLAIYKCLLIQLLGHYRQLLPSCYDKMLKGNHDTLGDESFNLFIIIDGLDEMDSIQRKSLVPFLAGIVVKCDSYNPGKIRVLLVSHDLADLRKMKCMENTTIVGLEPNDTQNAIKKFISKKQGELQELGLRDEEVQIVHRWILSRSNGEDFPAGVYISSRITI